MKSIGIVRELDDLGRIVLPMELRRTLHLERHDAVEIFVNGKDVVLRKYRPGCALCGGKKGLKEVGDREICAACRQKIAELDK